jgi:cell division protein FtsX
MNTKTLILVIVGTIIFISIWLFSMISALCLIVGFGFGIWQNKFITDIFNKWQRGIYLSQKSEIESEKRELEEKLDKLKRDS